MRSKMRDHMTKLAKLKAILRKLRRVVVAYSGGLDSTFLLKAAHDALGGENVLAVTARSETYPDSEYGESKAFANLIGAKQLTIYTRELDLKHFRTNPVNRCYYCKRELFRELKRIRRKYKMYYVLDGTNYDDLKDIRFGAQAAREYGVRSPLLEARITKGDLRKFSRKLGLPSWDKPSFACLASRIPFHSAITKKELSRIDEAERYLRRLGFKQVRVRAHKDIARLELSPDDFSTAIKLKEAINKKLKSLGFAYTTLDLIGYRTGSMHEAAK